MSVSRETEHQLITYAALIRKWNPKINLVAPSTVDGLEERHLLDCAQLSALSRSAKGDWVDLGSGAGLPGLVMAIYRPDIAVTMIEIDQRKSVFIRTVIRELGLKNATILTDRIENISSLSANHVSARALAPLPVLMPYVVQHMAPDGTAWLMKGRNWQEELDLAQKKWSFDYNIHASQTDREAAILEITRIQHV